MSVTLTIPVNELQSRKSERYPVVGAVALDAMAAIAGSTSAPTYERAWSEAFGYVVGAMADGATHRELAVVA